MIEFIHGNCTKVLWDRYKREAPFHFAFLDPPFNIGQDYSDHDDKMSRKDFLIMIGNAISAVSCNMVDGGVIALHGPDDLAEIYLDKCPRRSLTRIAWINWHYRFGQCNKSNWIDARCHCLIYKKGDAPHTWNPEDVLVPSDRATVYNDKRIHDTDGGGSRLPGTVWGVPSDGPYWGRVQGNSRERQPDCPNQLPEKYLERLIKAYTNPGDLILDPFCGSGTTAVVADALDRNCITIDVSQRCLDVAQDRVLRGAVRVDRLP